MQLFLVESYSHEVEHGGRKSRGVLGEPLRRRDGSRPKPGEGERIYLHVLALAPAELARFGARIDDDGNKQHDRWSLPRQSFIGREEWWIAIEGDVGWPRYPGRPLSSCCAIAADGVPRPTPLDDAALTRLRGMGVELP